MLISRTGRECLARAVMSREVAVLLGECGVTTGRCDKVCANVTVLEHTECHCGCHIDRCVGLQQGTHDTQKFSAQIPEMIILPALTELYFQTEVPSRAARGQH